MAITINTESYNLKWNRLLSRICYSYLFFIIVTKKMSSLYDVFRHVHDRLRRETQLSIVVPLYVEYISF